MREGMREGGREGGNERGRKGGRVLSSLKLVYLAVGRL